MTVVRDPEGAEPRILDELVDFTDKDVLEIGSGEGRLTWRYAERVRSVLGLDAAAEAVAAAREALPAHLRARVTFAVADVTATAPPASAFDLALLAWSL